MVVKSANKNKEKKLQFIHAAYQITYILFWNLKIMFLLHRDKVTLNTSATDLCVKHVVIII